MKITFQFPAQVKQFIKEERISLDEVEHSILTVIDEELVDKNDKPIYCNEVAIIINGIHKREKMVFIRPEEITKKKPLLTSAVEGNGYSIYYAVFREK